MKIIVKGGYLVEILKIRDHNHVDCLYWHLLLSVGTQRVAGRGF